MTNKNSSLIFSQLNYIQEYWNLVLRHILRDILHETADWRHIAIFHPTCCKGKPPLRAYGGEGYSESEEERFEKEER